MDISSPTGQARVGASFVILVGCLVALIATGLDLPWSQLRVCAVVGAGDVAIGAVSLVLPWRRLSARALLLFPAMMAASVAALGLLTTSAAEPFLALLTLSVLFVGLTQQRWTTARSLPVLAAVWWPAYPVHDFSVIVRLPMALAVWLAVGELLSLYRAQQQERVAALAVEAETDPLTGLANRRGLARSLAACHEAVTVLYLDLDHFKDFNDQHGHSAGDALLKNFGAVIHESVRGDDIAVRTGGEEFVVVTRGVADGAQLDRRIRSAWHHAEPLVTFSSGSAVQRRGEATTITMQRADDALYTAKTLGRDMLVVDPAPMLPPESLASRPQLRVPRQIRRRAADQVRPSLTRS